MWNSRVYSQLIVFPCQSRRAPRFKLRCLKAEIQPSEHVAIFRTLWSAFHWIQLASGGEKLSLKTKWKNNKFSNCYNFRLPPILHGDDPSRRHYCPERRSVPKREAPGSSWVPRAPDCPQGLRRPTLPRLHPTVSRVGSSHPDEPIVSTQTRMAQEKATQAAPCSLNRLAIRFKLLLFIF